MTVLHWMFGQYVGLGLTYFALCIGTPNRLLGRGRIFSRWLRRLVHISPPMLFRLWQIIMLGGLVVLPLDVFVSNGVSNVVGWLVSSALFLDDLLTGDDNDPKWRWLTGKVKLKMPAPVKLRPIDRLTPCAAKLLQWRA